MSRHGISCGVDDGGDLTSVTPAGPPDPSGLRGADVGVRGALDLVP